ncbi:MULTISPECIES: BspA family leucine-rich repeat surface protein [unclassified Lactococcus]|uniref:BspA family leucine-rich repeat surface protein n=1 Tax=unclassified Lactococcus TaxID=2643510 RepID=UPI0011CAC6BD|nr:MULTISPECIES: BspA family leucine-rich repeat surface protein [unclassified Lactococcus]MQW24032.1 BspA family leucine-rich repeat surface protein [Lactococcus sp. dk101]TXK36684.1 BspA family leucine-rich repeat surface protein [Lactococcus sp. dk310]
MKKKFGVSSSIALLLLGSVGTPIAFAETSPDISSELIQGKGETKEKVPNTINLSSGETSSSENTNEASDVTKIAIDEEKKDKNITTSQVSPAISPTVQAETSSIITGSWGTATYDFDEETGTITAHDGTISGGWSHSAANHPTGIPISSIKHVVFGNNVILARDGGWLFSNYTNLVSISGRPDASRVVNTNAMFYKANNLVSANLGDWDTSNLLQTSNMFDGCTSLVEVNLNGWDFSKVFNMQSMFQYATSLKTINNINNWDTSNVTNMGWMFFECNSLNELNINNWDTSTVTNMQSMFFGNSSLTALDINNWNTSNVTNMGWMFSGMTGINELNLSNWNTSKVTNMSSVFENNTNLRNLDISKWDTSNTIDITDLFNNDSNLASLKIGDKSIFNATALLPTIDSSSGEYTGRWIDYATGITYDSSEDFMANYEGTNPGTYVWERNSLSVDAKDLTLYVGDTWSPKDSFISAKDTLGNSLSFDDITVIGAVDTTKVGSYPITYMNKNLSKQITVTVLENEENLSTKDLTIFEGEDWTVSDHFTDAKAKDGSAVSFYQLILEGQEEVNPSKAGKYSFKVTNGKTSNTVTLTVLKDQASVSVKDSTVMIGDSWTASDNFVSATDRYGNPLALGDLTVKGDVDTNKVGKYKVTYSWEVRNADGVLIDKKLSVDAYVTVADKTTEERTKYTPSKPQADKTRTINSRGLKTSNTPSRSTELPRTGEQSSISDLTVGIGLLSLSVLFGLVGYKKRKHSN